MTNEINETLKVLDEGGIILYPTDTVLGIGCDATNPFAVKKVYALKKRVENKALICLVSDFEMLKNYVEDIPDSIPDILEAQKKPTTIIYNTPKNLPSNLIGEDKTIAIRICKEGFCNQLIKAFKKPIVSTSANISGQVTPHSFKQIHSEIAKGVDYIVNLHQTEPDSTSPSTIIKVEPDQSIKIIRE